MFLSEGHSNTLTLHQIVWNFKGSSYGFLDVTSLDLRGGPHLYVALYSM